VYGIFCQQFFSAPDPSINLPVDEKIKLYFDTYRDGKHTQGPSRFSSYTIREYGTEVIPYLREYLRNADYFHYEVEPKDVTLGLIAYFFDYLHLYTNPIYKDDVNPYSLNKDDIQWFVDQYKCKLDQYICKVKVIDDVVLAGERNILSVAGYQINWANGKWIGGNEIEKYGHPNFFDSNNRFKISEIKKYYEERLGVKIGYRYSFAP